MSDLAEIYKIMRESSREKKQNNQAFSTALLDTLGVDYDSRNNGVHLIVFGENETIDFYPSTGKWIVRKGITSRGVKKLLERLGYE